MTGSLGILAEAANETAGLTAGGAIIMTACVTLVLGLLLFCMRRILTEERPQEHHHAPLDIDTWDVEP